MTLPLIRASEDYNQLCTTPGAYTWCRYDCEKSLNVSLLSCQGNPTCISTAHRSHAECMAECPCNTAGKCIMGCPCRSITPEVFIKVRKVNYVVFAESILLVGHWLHHADTRQSRQQYWRGSLVKDIHAQLASQQSTSTDYAAVARVSWQ